MCDAILNIIHKNRELLKERQYFKPKEQPKINIYDTLDKTKEISKIYNKKIDTNYFILFYEDKFKEKLKDFTYLQNINQFTDKRYFLKYVGVNGKFHNGGFLYKYDKNSITLINSKKKVWIILIDDNFIWFIKIKRDDEKKRDLFIEYLKSIEQK